MKNCIWDDNDDDDDVFNYNIKKKVLNSNWLWLSN